MAEVVVIGGGLAGLAAAAALGSAGHSVKVLESRPFLGGRATSYEVGNGEEAEFIDNCQHILLRCCVNLLDFYRRLGVEQDIAFSREFTFIEPGGRRSVLRSGMLPPPTHFVESFLKLRFMNFSEKLAVARAMQAIGKETNPATGRHDLDRISMLDGLKE
jgi:phytoene dehydrogenase-like protein